MTLDLVICVRHEAAAGPFTDSRVEPVDVTLYNPCNDEWIWLTGSTHILYHDNLTPSGRLQWDTRISCHNVRGIGLTRRKMYVSVGVDQGGGSTLAEPFDSPYHYQASSENTMSLVGKGRTENYRVFMHFHLTVTPDFEWHGFFEDFRLACR